MIKACACLLFVSLLFFSCFCLAPAQSGRPREKTNNPGNSGTKPALPGDAAATSSAPTKGAGKPKIPLLVALSRQRRYVMLPPANEVYAERIAKSLRRDDRLSVMFDPQKIKLEDAQTRLRAGQGTYLLLVRFEEIEDRDDSHSCPRGPRRVTSYKMDYTLLEPKAGSVVKKRSIQTFFSCDAGAKPLPGPFVKNCLNRSRDTLDDAAVKSMTGHVVTDLISNQ